MGSCWKFPWWAVDTNRNTGVSLSLISRTTAAVDITHLIGTVPRSLCKDQQMAGRLTRKWHSSQSHDYSWHHGCFHRAQYTTPLHPNTERWESVLVLRVFCAKLFVYVGME